MTNLLGKCTKYQPFSGKKKRNLANFHRTFSVMSGEPRCCQAYLVSTPPAHPGALGPKMEDEALSKWLNGEHHEPLDFGVFPPSIFGPILSVWEYLFPNLCPVGSCQVAFGERRIQGRQNMASLVTLFIEANTSGALQVRRGF